MKLNVIQQMLLDTDMLVIQLPVKIECDYCQYKEDAELMHYVADAAVCEVCFEHFN